MSLIRLAQLALMVIMAAVRVIVLNVQQVGLVILQVPITIVTQLEDKIVVHPVWI